MVQRLIVLAFLVVMATGSGANCPLPLCRCDQSVDDLSKRVIDCRSVGNSDLSVIVNITSPSNELFYELALSDNGITTIGPRAFEGLRFLKLELSGNPIANFDPEAFAGIADDLRIINLEGDGNSPFPLESMKNLSKLTEISFKNFKQGAINSSTKFEYFPDVEKLTLNNARITFMLSSSFSGKLTKIKYLTVTHNPILSEFPAPAIAKLRTLTHLIWNHNDMKEVRRQAFSQLTNLKELDLQSNLIEAFENNWYDGITNNLEFLNLHYNAITDNAIQSLGTPNWPKLHQLNLGLNQLRNIPSGLFSKMPDLAYLKLASNQIQQLKRSYFTGLGNMYSVELHENVISTMEREVFVDMPLLHIVDLESQTPGVTLNLTRESMIGAESVRELKLQFTNVVENELWDAVRELKNLTNLNVGSTGITNIPDLIFTDHNKLSLLDLSANNINQVTQASFHGLDGSLTSLNLKDNSVSVIDPCVLDGFNKLTQIFLANNLLTCDCRLIWLHDWIKSHSK